MCLLVKMKLFLLTSILLTFVLEQNAETNFIPKVTITKEPICAEGKTYCEDSETYPSQYISKLLKESSISLIDFPAAVGPGRTERNVGHSGCQYVVKTINPKKGKTTDGVWKYILQTDNKTQGVVIRECVNLEKPCLIPGEPPTQSQCNQVYKTYQFMGLKEDGQLEEISIPLPWDCQCSSLKMKI